MFKKVTTMRIKEKKEESSGTKDVQADEIYNIYRKIQQQKYKLKDNLFEILSDEGYSTYKSTSFYTSCFFFFTSYIPLRITY